MHSLLLSFRSVETKIDPGDDKCLKTFRGEQPFESRSVILLYGFTSLLFRNIFTL